MSRIKKAVGFVIRSMEYGETSKIISALTREAGVISLIAKGARAESRFGAALELLTLTEFVYYHREGLKTLSQATILRTFSELQGDYDRLATALRCARLVGRILEEDHAEERVFALFRSLLEALGREDELEVFELAFQVKLLGCLGWAPQLDRCAICGETPNQCWFSLEKGGLLCKRCRSGDPSGEIPVERGVVRGLYMALQMPLAKVRRLKLSPEVLAAGKGLVEDFVAHHFRPFSTARRAPRRG
jgi:DNA repair protein RecO (recombination protein O)